MQSVFTLTSTMPVVPLWVGRGPFFPNFVPWGAPRGGLRPAGQGRTRKGLLVAKDLSMRPRLSRFVASLAAGLTSSLLAVACAHAPAEERSALEQAVAAEDDLGAPDMSTPALEESEAQALLDDPSATRLDFDGDDPNDAPVDRVAIPPDREPMPSLMRTVTMGPSS